MSNLELPAYLQLEPVGQCNLRCQMCAIQFRRDGPPHGAPAFMAFETFVRIIDQFPGLAHLHLQGLGEPMMHPRFFDMVAHAAGRGIRVTTNSNMTLILNEKRATQCVNCGLDCIHVSIDGATPVTYESVRKRSRFERVVRNFELLLTAKRKAGSQNPTFRLVTVVMRQNLHELAAIVRLAHRWSIAAMFVQHLCHDFSESTLPDAYRPMREFVDRQTLLGEEEVVIARYFAEARRTAERLGVDLRLPTLGRERLPPPPGRRRCDWPWTGAYVSYEGHAMPCCMISTPDRLHFGNLKFEDASTVWNNKRYGEFRDQLSSGAPHELCRSCAVYQGTF